MIMHVIMLELQNADDAQQCADLLNGMEGRIDGLERVHAGVNFAASGFHVGLVTALRDKAALEAYATHPVHLEVLEWIKPRVANRALVDFEV